jgi:hypothetical protein
MIEAYDVTERILKPGSCEVHQLFDVVLICKDVKSSMDQKVCLEEASTVLKKTLVKLLSASDLAVLTSERLDSRLIHPSTLAAQTIVDEFKHLATSDKVTMLTRVADTGYANVFLAVNRELRKELVTAWTKPMTET